MKLQTTGIEFSNAGESPRISMDAKAEGADADLQCVVVNVMTRAGSDRAFPERGTSLSERVVRGEVFDSNQATHAANFAALDTRVFLDEFARDDVEHGISDLKLVPDGVEDRRLRMGIEATGLDGKTISGTIHV